MNQGRDGVKEKDVRGLVETPPLFESFDLDPLPARRFRAMPRHRGQGERLFGGTFLGQALYAAARTVEGRLCHSMHGHFLRPGAMGRAVTYAVDALRDGKSFCTRQVVAHQEDEALFQLVASFQREEAGLEHQVSMPDVPGPEMLPSEAERIEAALQRFPPELHAQIRRRGPVEALAVEPIDPFDATPRPARHHVWARARTRFPSTEANLHRAALAFISDGPALRTCLLPLALAAGDPGLRMLSLDHSVWFHRDFRVDDWLLFAVDSPSVSGGRGLSRGSVFGRDGRLLASFTQEGLVRHRAAPACA